MLEGLGKYKIMGINARNRDFIFPNNRRRFYPLVDDKLLTKKLALEAGIQVPELYGVIEFINQAGQVAEIAAPHKQFVIKPARGSGGDGITLVKDVIGGSFQKANGELISAGDMQYYITNILGGMYSMGGSSDKAILEYVVQFDPIFNEITYQGVPDIRIIVYKGVPIMAMLRLPTRKSDGKANLHKGGIGVGIEMSTGSTMYGVQGSKFVNEHPETLKPLAGRQIPRWPFLLEMASKFYDITKLGYVGVDIVLDKDKGPMVLEANARPGIAIQIANRCGLLSRTEKVDAVDVSKFTLRDRVNFALNAYK
ncbi:MAG: alpha-L-glutamate ligase-like protein [Alphaproteobacteria bacterium]|nr:alpha-L-glutamate ligase-like protein [Alphaproteobacteria bacterium]